jgi:RimJ/RimL family protein N-acetyltransferase
VSQPSLRTARLVLRPFRVGDATALWPITSDREAMRYWGPHERFQDTEDFVRMTAEADPAACCDFIVERDGEVIGKAGMWEKPEIGFFIAPWAQRQGYGREAVTAVIGHLFDTYDMPTLTADVDPENAASLALLQVLGFQETGRAARTIEILGEWRDSVYLELERPVGS